MIIEEAKFKIINPNTHEIMGILESLRNHTVLDVRIEGLHTDMIPVRVDQSYDKYKGYCIEVEFKIWTNPEVIGAKR